MLASFASVGNQIIKLLAAFIYRTVFLMILSKEYLGINGLFSNIMQLLSLAELGIGSAIVYRLYKAFAQENIDDIGALIRYFKTVYRNIALIVLAVSICVYPFITSIVNVDEVPSDVNVTVVYFLFIFQSVCGYFFAHKQAVLTADQRGHILTMLTTLIEVLSNVIRIVVLIITHNYLLVLASGIAITVITNVAINAAITKKYPDIFSCKSILPKDDQKAIMSDTAGLMCHKIGYIVVTSTDNLILTKYISLAAVGIYSNYAMIVSAVQVMISNAANSLVAIVGNYVNTNDKAATYQLYKRLLSGFYWLASVTSVCLYVLLNPFIRTWLDESFTFEMTVVAIVTLQYYLHVSRLANNIFVNACGLFMLDRLRPLVEASVNLVVSIVLAKSIGIAGVFIGTCVSAIVTFYWREPYLLYKLSFQKKGWRYVLSTIQWLCMTIVMCLLFHWLCSFFPGGWGGFLLQAIFCFAGVNLIYVAFMCKTDFFKYFAGKLLTKLGSGR